MCYSCPLLEIYVQCCGVTRVQVFTFLPQLHFSHSLDIFKRQNFIIQGLFLGMHVLCYRTIIVIVTTGLLPPFDSLTPFPESQRVTLPPPQQTEPRGRHCMTLVPSPCHTCIGAGGNSLMPPEWAYCCPFRSLSPSTKYLRGSIRIWQVQFKSRSLQPSFSQTFVIPYPIPYSKLTR